MNKPDIDIGLSLSPRTQKTLSHLEEILGEDGVVMLTLDGKAGELAVLLIAQGEATTMLMRVLEKIKQEDNLASP
jgi:hypothetical protein